MTKTDEMGDQFKGAVIGKLGEEAERNIFNGKAIPKDPIKRAQWVNDALISLEKTTDEQIINEIMRENGVNCANHNIGVMKNALKRRSKYTSLEAFIDVEIKKPTKGTSLKREDNALILSYLPKNFSRSMRCFCALVNSLPSNEVLPNSYCNCSVGFVETWWSQVIGEHVNVQLLESAITGSDKCSFRITW